MATLTVIEITETANIRDTVSDVFVAAANGGDEFVNAPGTWVEILNSGASVRTITFTSQNTSIGVEGYGQTIATTHLTPIIDATGTEVSMLIALPRQRFNDSDHKVQVSYSSETDLKIGVFILGVNKV